MYDNSLSTVIALWRLSGLEMAFYIVIAVFLIIFGIVIGIFLWKFPIRYISKRINPKSKEALELENDYRATFAQIVGGLFVLIGLLITGYQFFNNLKTYELERKSKEAERYSKAVELLTKSEELNRLGGIYALENLAGTNPDDYGPAVLQTLVAFLKTNAPAPPQSSAPDCPSPAPSPAPEASPTPISSPTPEASPTQTPMASPAPASSATPVTSPTPQAASEYITQEIINFIGEEQNLDPNGNPVELHLTRIDLMRMILNDKHFEFADFRGIYALSANFNKAQLQHAKFGKERDREAYLRCASFASANLEGASFNGAFLVGATFTGATFAKDTTFSLACLYGANFQGTDLSALSPGSITQEQFNSAYSDPNTTKLPSFLKWTEEAKTRKVYNCAQ
ncbi:MAG TPA: pentapeptide repeat-containing protein [Pyrinomonadaceae bacterium]|jgi:hypothetical protein|nr:pentapeptide repeat-containing protein [Pyrinomonadaceae bacterium]